MVQDWSGDHIYSRPSWPHGRVSTDIHSHTRFEEVQTVRRPPIAIEKALRDHCNIPAKRFFLGVILENGKTATFSGPGKIPDSAISQFFDAEGFARTMQDPDLVVARTPFDPSELGPDPTNSGFRDQYGSEFTSRRVNDRRRTQTQESFPETGYKTRKRPRPQGLRHAADDDDDAAPVPVEIPKRSIRIGDTDNVWNFYQERFKNCQQTACKLIAKAWVKAVEPKKQSHHPYTGSDEKAPEWWPKPWGNTKEDRVRHKEPDHLYKRERVHLLTHILRLIVEPRDKQHPDVQKSNLNVEKLEEVTTEALSAFFSDKENPSNAKKRAFLNEIFKVALFEERFKNGEIDADTIVYVVTEDKSHDAFAADGLGGRDDDDEPASATSSRSPSKVTAPPHPILVAPNSSHAAGPLQDAHFLSTLPVRGNSLPPHMVSSELGNEHAHFVDGNPMSVNTGGPTSLHESASLPMQDMVPSTHDGGRRSSLIFNPSSEYTNPTGPAIFSPQWQTASAAPATSSMYSFTQQQNPNHASFGSQTNMPIPPPNQTYINPAFDNMPRSPFDANHGAMFRTGAGVSQASMSSTQSYHTNYIPDGRPIPGQSLKVEQLTPHQQLH